MRSSFKSRLNTAFSDLRREGYFAKQSWKCCQSCGCATIPTTLQDKYVFYHKQDAEMRDEQGYCYLAWSGDGPTIRAILEAAGLDVKWDGSTSTRFRVSLNPEA